MIAHRARIGSSLERLPKFIGIGVKTARPDFFQSEDIKRFVVSGWCANESDCSAGRKTNSAQKCNWRSLRDFAAYPSWEAMRSSLGKRCSAALISLEPAGIAALDDARGNGERSQPGSTSVWATVLAVRETLGNSPALRYRPVAPMRAHLICGLSGASLPVPGWNSVSIPGGSRLYAT